MPIHAKRACFRYASGRRIKWSSAMAGALNAELPFGLAQADRDRTKAFRFYRAL